MRRMIVASLAGLMLFGTAHAAEIGDVVCSYNGEPFACGQPVAMADGSIVSPNRAVEDFNSEQIPGKLFSWDQVEQVMPGAKEHAANKPDTVPVPKAMPVELAPVLHIERAPSEDSPTYGAAEVVR